MEIICVDTDIIIDFSKGHTTLLDTYLELKEKNKAILIVSSISIFEFFTGVVEKKIPEAELLFSSFQVHEVSEDIAKLSAYLNRKYKLIHKIDINDIYIAATSIALKAKLLTKTKKHFKYIPEVVFAS
ncbi:MAG TPA: PIN domain-containing protein [Candidatus Woesebacteria bacterium]|nr:PIN domain-containing protein [Candidatus Woesebacteria bacterium]